MESEWNNHFLFRRQHPNQVEIMSQVKRKLRLMMNMMWGRTETESGLLYEYIIR